MNLRRKLVRWPKKKTCDNYKVGGFKISSLDRHVNYFLVKNTLSLRGIYEEIRFPRKSHVTLHRLYDEIVSSLLYEEITLILFFHVIFS